MREDNTGLKMGEWFNPTKKYKLTESQRQRKKRGKSIWTRDEIVEPYEVRKGQWV